MFNLLKLWKFFVPTLHISTGDGGGGGQPANTTQTAELPEWARPYAKDILAKGQALTDINQNPYQKYNQQRIADFTPLQQQSQASAANMTPAWQANLGSQFAAQAGQYQPGQFGTRDVTTGSFVQPGTSQSYMSPYMQNVVDTQQREATRQSDIQRGQNQAQAVSAGAFGGSRQALVEAERQRNLGTQLGNIQATGSQAAFEQAQNQFNQEQQRRLQAAMGNQQTRMQAQQLGEQSRQFGSNAALQAASTLGTLGGQQFQQGMDINKLQNAYGGQQQAMQQQGLDLAYQDFLNQQNYPYKQLGYFSDLLRGTPTGSSSVTQMYGAQPSMLQTLGGLGLGAYGLSKYMAEGGEVKTYAGDKGSVTSEDNTADIIDKLSDAQVQQALQAAKIRGDQENVALLSEEMAERASLRSGMGAAFNALPGGQQENVIQAAGGGILAFATGGKPPRTSEEYIAQAMGTEYKAPTREEREAGIEEELTYQKGKRGPSVTAPYLEEVKGERAALAKMGEEGKGLAALMAAKALMTSPNLAAGVGNALGSAGETLARTKKEQLEANRTLRESEMKLAMADQARDEGMLDKATALYKEAETLKRDGIKELRTANLTAANTLAHKEASKYTADTHLAGQKLTANRATDLEKVASSFLGETLAADPSIKNDPAKLAAAQAKAYKEAADAMGRYPGSARVDAAGAAQITKLLADDEELGFLRTQRAMYGGKDLTPEQQKKVDKLDERITAREKEIRQGSAKASAAPGANPPAPAAPQTVTIGGNTYTRPPSMSDAQWKSYQEYVKGNK